MPIFTFKGVKPERVKEYFKTVGEVAQLVNVDVEQFVFWHQEATIIGNGYEVDAIHINVDWVGRPLKQETVAKHIVDFFNKDSKNVYVKFNEINSFLYLNGENIA